MNSELIDCFDFGSFKTSHCDSGSEEIRKVYSLLTGDRVVEDSADENISCSTEHPYQVWSSSLIQAAVKQLGSKEASRFIVTKNSDWTDRIVESTAEVLFERCNADKLYFLPSSTGCLMGLGETSGLVLDSGHRRSRVDCVQDGFELQFGHSATNVGGFTLNRLINEREFVTANCIYMDKLKKDCFFLNSFSKDIKLDEVEENYTLPDKKTIKVGHVKYEVPQTLFEPENADLRDKSIVAIVEETINKVKNQFDCTRLVVTGGNVRFKGFGRMIRAKIDKNIRLDDDVETEMRGIRGAKVLSSLGSIERLWFSREEYEEYGKYGAVLKTQ